MKYDCLHSLVHKRRVYQLEHGLFHAHGNLKMGPQYVAVNKHEVTQSRLHGSWSSSTTLMYLSGIKGPLRLTSWRTILGQYVM